MGYTNTQIFIQKCTFDLPLIGTYQTFDVMDTTYTFGINSIAVYNNNVIAVFSSQTKNSINSNYAMFITYPICITNEYYITVNAPLTLTGLVASLSTTIKQYMVAIKKTTCAIPEQAAAALKTPVDI